MAARKYIFNFKFTLKKFVMPFLTKDYALAQTKEYYNGGETVTAERNKLKCNSQYFFS